MPASGKETWILILLLGVWPSGYGVVFRYYYRNGSARARSNRVALIFFFFLCFALDQIQLDLTYTPRELNAYLDIREYMSVVE